MGNSIVHKLDVFCCIEILLHNVCNLESRHRLRVLYRSAGHLVCMARRNYRGWSMVVWHVVFSATLIHNKAQFTQIHNTLLRVVHKLCKRFFEIRHVIRGANVVGKLQFPGMFNRNKS
jgi:hypothetical protein